MFTSSVYEARNNFSALVKKAEEGDPVEITRHNKVIAYIVSAEDFEEPAEKISQNWLLDWREKNMNFLSQNNEE